MRFLANYLLNMRSLAVTLALFVSTLQSGRRYGGDMDTRCVHITGTQSCQLLRLAREGKVVTAVRVDEVQLSSLDPSVRCLQDLNTPDLTRILGIRDGYPLELLIPGSKSRRWTSDLRTKVLSAPIPAGGFLELLPGTDTENALHIPDGLRFFIEAPELAFVQRAHALKGCVARDVMSRHAALLRLLEFGDECCGWYTRNPHNPQKGKIRYDKPNECTRFATPETIRAFVENARHIDGLKLARTACKYIIDESGSPMESYINHGLALPPRLGGVSIGIPLANKQLVTSEEIKASLKHSSLRPDMQWPELLTVVEYYGDEEHAGKPARIEDKNRMQDYATAGYAAFPLMFDDVRSAAALGKTIEMLAREFMKRGVSRELYRVRRILHDEDSRARQTTLVATLLPPVMRYGNV